MDEYTGLGASSVSMCSRSTHGRTAAAMKTAVTGHAQNTLEFHLVM